MDTPRLDTFRGRTIRTAHLVSTLHGEAGTVELTAFAVKIGMNPTWIQYKGSHREHFDLMNSRCDTAIAAGAVIDRRLLGQTLVEKRSALSEI